MVLLKNIAFLAVLVICGHTLMECFVGKESFLSYICGVTIGAYVTSVYFELKQQRLLMAIIEAANEINKTNGGKK